PLRHRIQRLRRRLQLPNRGLQPRVYAVTEISQSPVQARRRCLAEVVSVNQHCRHPVFVTEGQPSSSRSGSREQRRRHPFFVGEDLWSSWQNLSGGLQPFTETLPSPSRHRTCSCLQVHHPLLL
ncbi:hypothetical protein PIB30_113646, partial [Stylosanthes scabra]|nr:hypothetical protein [Stylosanthes scabra]